MKNVIFASRTPNIVIAKPGQQAFTTAGTYQWVCPPGVTKISCVIISAGQSCTKVSNYHAGGYGGSLRYQNDIPVVPGQTYTIVVGGPSLNRALIGSSAFGMDAGGYNVGTPFSDKVKGGWGGAQGNGSNNGYGGHAGGYYNGTNGTGTGNERCGDGTGLLGLKGTLGSASVAGNYGGGGGGQYISGARGAVRIIWGEGRAYPNINVADVAA